MDRPADPGDFPRVPSGHVLSETAGARQGLQSPEAAQSARKTPDQTGAFSGGLHRRGNGKIFEAANGFRQRPLNLVRAP